MKTIHLFQNKKYIIKDIIIITVIFLIMLVIIINPKHYSKVFLYGLTLFSTSVLPGLFPFMILTRILISLNAIKSVTKVFASPMRKLFNSPDISSFVMIISIISGYPIGAKLISDLYESNAITKQEAENTLTYSMSSGPIFIIGTVGAILLGSVKAGVIIFISHIISNFITGIILTRTKKNKHLQQQEEKTPYTLPNHSINEIISQSMQSSIQSILVVGGFITIFYCLIEILFSLKIIDFIGYPIKLLFTQINVEPQIFRGVLSGIIEVTRGIKELSVYFLESPIIIASLCSAIISFSGLSIILQSSALLIKTKIKTRFLIKCKLIHSIICFIICFLLCSLFL